MASSLEIREVFEAVYAKMTTSPKQLIIGDTDYIIQLLIDYSKSKTKRSVKYPLVAIVNDFQEREKSALIDCSINMIIATSTRKEFDNDSRMDNFKNILNPMWLDWLCAMKKTRYILPQYVFEFEKIDRYSQGRKAIFDNQGSCDYVDAIEIKNLKISIYKQKLNLQENGLIF